jgi:hypothetical protein
MATLIKTDGTEQEVQPKDGKGFLLEEMYALIGCDTVQAVYLADERTMWLDEESKLKSPWPPVNEKATKLLAEAGGIPGDVVLGNVLIFPCDPNDDADAEEPCNQGFDPSEND